jgi:hypothetical protein
MRTITELMEYLTRLCLRPTKRADRSARAVLCQGEPCNLGAGRIFVAPIAGS